MKPGRPRYHNKATFVSWLDEGEWVCTMYRLGKENHQGIGYLDDGTMFVVEDGYRHVGERVKVTVTSMLQTSAGRMIFGRIHP